MSGNDKTLIFGFDALDFDYLDAFSELPNFSRLRSDGVESPLISTHPPWTGSAWPSMYTGSNPGIHDTHGFFSYDGYPDDASVVSRADVQAPALWNYLTTRNIPTIVLNVPVTHPADPIEGVLVPGYLAPEDEPGHPKGIRDTLSDAVGGKYRIYSRSETGDGGEKLDGYVDLIRMRASAATYLLSEFDWRLAVIQVQKTDTVFHNFESDKAFRRVYRAADDLIGDVLDTVGNPNVIVCSDHGIGPVDGYKVFINDILSEHGYLETKSEKDGPWLSERKSELTGDGDESETDPSVIERSLAKAVTTLATRTPLSPGNVFAAARRVGLESVLRDIVPHHLVSSSSRGVNWHNSTAYCRNGSEMGIRVNLAGREPAGIVPQEEYEQTRSDLIDLLSTLKTPDGDLVFEFVDRYEDVYDSDVTTNACDIVFRPKNMNNTIHTGLVGRKFLPANSFDHKVEGVFMAVGPAFNQRASVSALSLTDVAPIAMASLGCPVPEQMTGTVPDDLLEQDISREAFDEVQYATATSNSLDKRGVENRLEDLGYL